MGSVQGDEHRLQKACRALCEMILTRPASNFAIVQELFGGARTISRLFSVARSSHECQKCIIEEIADIGILKEDTDEMLSLGYKCKPANMRLTFWDGEGQLAGYMIARNDGIVGAAPEWYVFESVFSKYHHRHNCVSRPGRYSVKVGEALHTVSGVMFAQQNKRNKRCAQVAIRSLLSRLPHCANITYAQINDLAKEFPGDSDNFSPEKGLSAAQIEGVLTKLGVRFRSINYEKLAKEGAKEWAAKEDWSDVVVEERASRVEHHELDLIKALHIQFKYGKFLYDGAESGIGALVGFRTFDGKERSLHIIPIFGHTFNKDSWVPDSRKFYFKPESDDQEGKDSENEHVAGYVQSDSWTSSFIGHDDNLGSDYCIPRAYLRPEDVTYVVELLAPNVAFSGIEAEAVAYKMLGAVMGQVDSISPWLIRLTSAFASGDVVLRSVSVSPEDYFRHLKVSDDWEYRHEDGQTLEGFGRVEFPKMFWVVEVSLPQLFPANERKIGEVVIDATDSRVVDAIYNPKLTPILISAVKWIRLPGNYYFPDAACPEDEDDAIHFSSAPSAFESHLPVIVLSNDQEA